MRSPAHEVARPADAAASTGSAGEHRARRSQVGLEVLLRRLPARFARLLDPFAPERRAVGAGGLVRAPISRAGRRAPCAPPRSCRPPPPARVRRGRARPAALRARHASSRRRGTPAVGRPRDDGHAGAAVCRHAIDRGAGGGGRRTDSRRAARALRRRAGTNVRDAAAWVGRVRRGHRRAAAAAAAARSRGRNRGRPGGPTPAGRPHAPWRPDFERQSPASGHDAASCLTQPPAAKLVACMP